MIAFALALESGVAAAQTVLPADAKQSCTVTKKEFKSWFGSNGSVVPPNSVDFPANEANDCTFFKSAEHMFLWVTSQPSRGSSSSYVFDSSPFYGVSPPDQDKKRRLIAQDRSNFDQRKGATLAISQRGPEGEPVLFADTGVMHKIVQAEVYRREEQSISKIEIGRIDIEEGKVPLFYDKQGKPIENPILRHIASGQGIEIKPPPGNTILSSNGQRFFLDVSGRAVAAQPGQADDHVLMAQGDRLVNYMIHVNDVYAYFLTGTRNHKLDLKVFPTSRPELNLIKKYARDHGLAFFPDERALVVELKSSWIELADEKDYANYISIKADVPKFNMLSDGHWHQIGWRQGVKLAMVGMHVAFSVKGHPELIWATFEHINNTPNARYRYETKQDQPWSRQNCGTWLFSSGHAEPDDHPNSCYGTSVDACAIRQTVDAAGHCVGANHPRMHMDGSDIRPYQNDTIGASDILRINPWGNSEFRAPFNAKIISINNSIRGHLTKDDVRKNYIMVGATWLATLSSPGSVGNDCTQNDTKGSNCLANSTIETFQQPSNCLNCHHRNPEDMLGRVSHVYWSLYPLFPDPPNP